MQKMQKNAKNAEKEVKTMDCTPTYENIFVSHNVISNHRRYTSIHFHNDYEIYYLLDGNTNYFIGDEIFHISPGSFVFIPKGVLHKTDSKTCLVNERFLINIDDSILDSDIRCILNELCEQRVVNTSKSDFPLFKEITNRIKAEYDGNAPFRMAMLKIYVSELLIKINRKKYGYKPKYSETEQLIQDISEYISNNYSSDLSLKTLATKFAVSESYLSRKFKELSGFGLNEYIIYVRITKAEQILKTENILITEAAQRCGFNDSNYFSTVFKKLKGTTPLKYARAFRDRDTDLL